jgi:hypothetical protein
VVFRCKDSGVRMLGEEPHLQDFMHVLVAPLEGLPAQASVRRAAPVLASIKAALA